MDRLKKKPAQTSGEKRPATVAPRCIVIAGPNGAGKTTFAQRFLRDESIAHFINADLIAAGLSPLAPDNARFAAGKVFLRELDRLADQRASFAFETTLSGLTHTRRLARLKTAGYRIDLIFLRLSSPQMALRRVAARVRNGGHNIPRADVLRRFKRGWKNFPFYRALVDGWAVYDNSGHTPVLIEESE